MLPELFAQHPPPWAFDDNHPGFEGRLIVWDANKGIVIDLGDMEDCTAADILLARAIAALPEQYGLLCGILEALEHNDPWTRQARANTATSIRTALDKAGITKENSHA